MVYQYSTDNHDIRFHTAYLSAAIDFISYINLIDIIYIYVCV